MSFRAVEALARRLSSGGNSATNVKREEASFSEVLGPSFSTGVATRVAGLD